MIFRLSTEACAATTATPLYSPDLHTAQQADHVLREIINARQNSEEPPRNPPWNEQPFKRYRQIWRQLQICDGVLCRKYTPDSSQETVTVPILPESLQAQALMRCHDTPTAGHQGSEKTLHRLRSEAYWVGMCQDVEQHCRECTVCQQSKLPTPMRAPLTNVPIGRPWQMIAADILEVPHSTNNNQYLLVVQDYFTKWVEAIAIPDQTAVRITNELTKIFCTYGLPDILHSDQGRNFESTILAETLSAFGIKKSRTTAYHPQGDGIVEIEPLKTAASTSL